VVTPRRGLVLSGGKIAFKARLDGREAGPCRWTLEGDPAPDGCLGADSGDFQAPDLDDVARFRIRARRVEDGAQGEAAVVVLPWLPFSVVDQVQGPGWREAWDPDLPFWDLEAARRFRTGAQVQEVAGTTPSVEVVAGYGLPCRLGWPPWPAAEAQLLSWCDGAETVRRDVTGQEAAAILLNASPCTPVRLEALQRAGREPEGWWSRSLCFRVNLRGLVPVRKPRHGSAAADAAPVLGAPAGIQLLSQGTEEPSFLVVDEANHALFLVKDGERPVAWCGSPGTPGHRDGAGEHCRFNRPTGLAVDSWARGRPFSVRFPRGWDAWVADTGNHVIRAVKHTGAVTTLAGQPGQPGHRDAAEPREARFTEPRGLVRAGDGTLFVADSGNHVIRRLGPRDGPVTTVAGVPGSRGVEDGPAGTARFWDLKGIALDGEGLLVADGHSIRRVRPDGRVQTLLGAPLDPGFTAEWEREGPLAGVPCLRDPYGLARTRTGLAIADRGNHAVRVYEFGPGRLWTLAGDPALPGNRPGLLRDGLPGPLDPRYGTLDSPRDLTLSREQQFLAVSAGGALMVLAQAPLGPGPPGPRLTLEPTAREVAAGTPVTLTARIPGPLEAPPLGEDGELFPTLDWWAQFLDPDGAPAQAVVQGTATLGRTFTFSGGFTAPGTGTVLLRWLTAEGVSGHTRARITVR
jgi:hypothetical protein